MKRCRQRALACLVILALAASVLSLPDLARAGDSGQAGWRGDPGGAQVAIGAVREPGPVAMIIDGLVVRPVGLVTTVLGTVAFIVTLPFSALGGNVGEAGEQLVVAPAAYTFSRCLGCFGGES